MMYGFGRLQQRALCVFNQFQPYDKIASKGGVGGLKMQCDLSEQTSMLHAH